MKNYGLTKERGGRDREEEGQRKEEEGRKRFDGVNEKEEEKPGAKRGARRKGE